MDDSPGIVAAPPRFASRRTRLLLVILIAVAVVPVSFYFYVKTHVEEWILDSLRNGHSVKPRAFEWDVSSSCDKVAVHGGLAIVGAGSNRLVLDVSDPTSPRLLSEVRSEDQLTTIMFGSASPTEENFGSKLLSGMVGWTAFEAVAFEIRASSKFAFITAMNVGTEIVDYSDPKNPKRIESDQKVAGSEWFPGEDWGIPFREPFVAQLTSEGLRILDASDASAPRSVGFCPISGIAPTADSFPAVAVTASFIYLASDPLGLLVFDVAEPSAPKLAGQMKLPKTQQWFGSLAASGNLVFALDEAQVLHVIDISDPKTPIEKSVLTLPASDLTVLAAADSLLLAALDKVGVLIINVEGPAHPSILSTYKLAQGASDVAVEGSRAYVAAGKQGLIILDLADPAAPVELGNYKIDGKHLYCKVMEDGRIVTSATPDDEYRRLAALQKNHMTFGKN